MSPETGANSTVVLETRVVRGSGGGPDKTILNTPRFLAASGYHTICAYMHPPGDAGFEQLRRKAERWGAPLLSIPDRGAWDWRVVRQMLDVCRREKVAVWHGHDYKSNALGLLLRRFRPMRLVTTVHGWVHRTSRTSLYYWIDRLCLRHYERVICVSEDLHQRCLECGVPAARCALIENAIDTEEFSRRRTVAQARRRLGLAVDRPVIGAVGRLSAEKGFDVLIRAVGQLLQGGRDVELLIVGEGAEQSRLRALIAELGLTERVRLLGYRADLHELYEALDVFALSSHREGLPNVLLEAMALGVPVVATRIAGIPRLIRDGENGLLVNPGDTNELTRALAQLLGEPELGSRLARSGRNTIEEGYSFATRMGKVRALYDDLLGGFWGSEGCQPEGTVPGPSV
jgi:glycosyltransferase involved in cell wall biosynthesis